MDVGNRLRNRGGAGAGRPLSAIPGGVAPVLAAVGLVIVAFVSVSLLNGTVPTLPGGGGGGTLHTPTPSNIVITDPRANVPGTLVYAKDGNIWLQAGTKATQLTTSGSDSMPTWSADGKWVYFIRSLDKQGRWLVNGASRLYELSVPYLMRVRPDASNGVVIVGGTFARGAYLWSYFIRQPSVSPDGKTAAVISDGPNPTTSDLVLKFINTSTGAITNPRLPDISGLGHQDPAWSPDGKSVLYVRNGREGTRGAPIIIRYDIATKKSTALTGAGYIAPAWSPDGRYIAATKTDAFGTDIVILDARNRCRASPPDERHELVRPGLVAGRRLDRVLPGGPRRGGSRAREAHGYGTAVGRRRHAGADRRCGPRCELAAGLVHPRRPAAEADPEPDAPVPEWFRRDPVSPPGPGYLERLASRSASVGTVLCVGLDPDPEALPEGLPPGLAGVEAFAALILEAVAPFAAAVKPNLAFFEAFGSAGLAALERIRARVPAGVLVVVDAKRGDIGSTSARHAAALFDGLGADAVTVSPYLGEEAIAPLLERGDRFAYVLCRTSNPGAGELQDLLVAGDAGSEGDAGAPGEPLWARVRSQDRRMGPRRHGRARRGRDRARGAGSHPGDRPRAGHARAWRGHAGRLARAGAGQGPRNGPARRWQARRRPPRQRLPEHCRGSPRSPCRGGFG